MSRDPPAPHALGIDVGTSGCRIVVIDAQGQPIAESHRALPPSRDVNGLLCQQPADWWVAVCACLRVVGKQTDLGQIRALAVDSTSGTVLLADEIGRPLTCGIMYNDQRPAAIARRIKHVAPNCAAASVSSSLAKLVWLQQTSAGSSGARFALHAADWITGRLIGRFGHSDEHNALKCGYDPIARQWPDWLPDLGINTTLLPEVRVPGSRLDRIEPALADAFGLSRHTDVCSGTTDSVAAFIASGASTEGDAVTVLGSTLVVKVLSNAPVVATEHGIYSHRIGELWLVGGASNSGGGALARYMPLAEIEALSAQLDATQETSLDYYPLPATGERFPVADPEMTSQVTPLPDDRITLLHGLLDGIARIEKRAYYTLADLGATPVRRVYTTGSGAANPAWRAIRQRVLGSEFCAPLHEQAAYGTARLAAGMTRVACR